jgi:protein O-mannosyl-transferase
MDHSHMNMKHRLVLVFVALLITYAYLVWPALSGPFLFDDFHNLQNLQMISGTVDWRHIGDYLAAFTGSPGRPIAALSFLINDYAWPSHAFSFKYTNLFIHLLNGVLLFGFLRQLAKNSPALPQHLFWPLAAMAAWLIHPLQLSAQLLVVQRMTLLAATFSIAGLWAYTLLLARSKNTSDAFAAMAALGTATILAFLCKENGALLPLFALVLNATLLRTVLESKSKAIRRFIGCACALPAIAVVYVIMQQGLNPDAYQARSFTLTERVFTQAHILIDYLKSILMPRLSGSGIYHDDYLVYQSLFAPISTFIYAALIAVGIIWAIVKRKSNGLLSFAILWFFAGHAMESTVLPLELYFEHRNYLPLLGPVIALTAVPFLLKKHIKLGYGLLLGWLALLMLATGLQAPVWGDYGRLSAIWSLEQPNSTRTTLQLAQYYHDSGQPEKAAELLIGKLSAGGNNEVDLTMATLLAICRSPSTTYTGQIFNESEVAASHGAFSLTAMDTTAKLGMAVTEKQCDSLIDVDGWWNLSNALLSNPNYRANIGTLRIERAMMYARHGNLNGYLDEMASAFEASPNVVLSQEIARALLGAGMPDKAEKWLNKGLLVKQPFFDGMMNSDKEKSREMLLQLGKDKKMR